MYKKKSSTEISLDNPTENIACASNSEMEGTAEDRYEWKRCCIGANQSTEIYTG